MHTTNQPEPHAANLAARDVLADAAHVFLAAQQPVLVEELQPRPVTLVGNAAPVTAGASVGAADRMLSELDDLADL